MVASDHARAFEAGQATRADVCSVAAMVPLTDRTCIGH
jgi:hypothetical protein